MLDGSPTISCPFGDHWTNIVGVGFPEYFIHLKSFAHIRNSPLNTHAELSLFVSYILLTTYAVVVSVVHTLMHLISCKHFSKIAKIKSRVYLSMYVYTVHYTAHMNCVYYHVHVPDTATK